MSIQPISSGKATAADPSASHASATARNISQPVIQKPIHEQLQATQSPEATNRPQSQLTRYASRDSTPAEERRPQHTKALEHRLKEEGLQESSVPVDVPISGDKPSSGDSIGHPPDSSVPSYLADYAKLQRPPRLPLPIAEVDHAPGSPLLAPVAPEHEDVSIFEQDADLPRKTSMLSSTTVDEEELGDELSPFAIDSALSAKVVPTLVEWRQPGDRVYVTGTFANWARKFKLHKKYVRDLISTYSSLFAQSQLLHISAELHWLLFQPRTFLVNPIGKDM